MTASRAGVVGPVTAMGNWSLLDLWKTLGTRVNDSTRWAQDLGYLSPVLLGQGSRDASRSH
jgi:hypothetical protein